MAQHRTLNTVIHEALRRDLDRMSRGLADFDPGDSARAAGIVRTFNNFGTQLHRHHDDEEQYFWPALRQLDADTEVMAELAGEHERLSATLSSAESTMASFSASPEAVHAASARSAMIELRAVLDEHLSHEERDLEPFAADHLRSPEIKQATGAVVKRHMRTMGTFFSWLLDDATPEARAFIRKDLPPPIRILATTIGGRRYRRQIAAFWH